MGKTMQLQMKPWHRTTLKAGGAALLFVAAVVGYLIYRHEPGMTVFIENADRRAVLKECLNAAGVQFDVTDRGGFRAKPGSVQRMEIIWGRFEGGYAVPPVEFCREQQRQQSRY
jgi:flagellar biosynthesis/type III secretory pathway M-ring protein FliF/YscJ